MNELLNRARDYRKYTQLARMVHYHMADWRAWLNQIVGGLTVLAAALASTGILTKVNSNPGFGLTLAAGAIAFVAAVLAGLQSFFKFGEAAERHRSAAADYGEVMRNLELFLAQYEPGNSADFETAFKGLQACAKTIADLDKKGPGYPGRLYWRIEARGSATRHRRCSDAATVKDALPRGRRR